MTDVSCVYCIKHKLDTEWENIYIGSTNNLQFRIRGHKSRCYKEGQKEYNKSAYKYIRENGGFENFEFIILEECDIEKLKRLEQSYMDVYKPTLNMCNANGFDKKEWYEINKEKLSQQKKEYREINKEKIQQIKKEYHEKNKEKHNETSKKYREINREKLHKQANQKFNCECGGRFTRANKLKHLKTKMHQDYLLNKK